MPHRTSIIQDDHRVRSINEFTAAGLPHGNPGPWTADVLKEISRKFNISVDTLPEQLRIQLGVLEQCWPYIRKTSKAYHRFEPNKKDPQGNCYGILFHFEPRRRLPDNFRTQSISPFYWARNTDIKSAINILKDEELIRPSKWIEDLSPNADFSNWNDVWIPRWASTAEGASIPILRQLNRLPSLVGYSPFDPSA